MLGLMSHIQQMNRIAAWLRECPADHRANRRYRSPFGDEHHLMVGWTLQGKGAEWSGEIEQVADPSLEHPRRPRAVWDKIEDQFERLTILWAGRDCVGTNTDLVGQWNSDRDEHAR